MWEKLLVGQDFNNTNLVTKMNVTIEKSNNEAVIDFNFSRHKDLSTLKSDIHLGLAASVNITFSGR